jgi:hypothetical protein
MDQFAGGAPAGLEPARCCHHLILSFVGAPAAHSAGRGISNAAEPMAR